MGKGILEVNLVDAKGLADTDAIGDMDPYVVIQYRNQERKSSVARGPNSCNYRSSSYQLLNHQNHSKTIYVHFPATSIDVKFDAAGQGMNPTWNETFKFLVQYSGDDSHHKLILRIMDEDTFTADDFVGQATINVADVISLGLENGKGEMHTCKHRVVLADQTYCGEIRVGVSFIPKVDQDEGEDFGGWRNSFHS